MTSIRDLSSFDNRHFSRGKPKWVESFWRLFSSVVFKSGLIHHYGVKRFLLRCFGASVGRGVLIKPGVTITFPWKLCIGEHSWIGEGVWIDNLDHVSIGSHVCISQGAYLCTGNHDYKKTTFDLMTAPIHIEDGVWIAAKAVVAPGTILRKGSVLGMQSLASGELDPFGVYQGNPSKKIRTYA